jgi:uncharacterized RDD family membrane protein YckC
VSTDTRAIPAHPVAGASPRAGVLRRLLAFALDAVVVSMLVFLVALLASVVLGPAIRFDLAHPDPSARVIVAPGRSALNAVLATIATGAYFAGSWSWRAATPCQELLQMRVTAVAGGGSRSVSVGTALVRWIVLIPPFGLVTALTAILDGLPAILLAVGALWALALLVSTIANPGRRGIHDVASGTMVVRSESGVR